MGVPSLDPSGFPHGRREASGTAFSAGWLCSVRHKIDSWDPVLPVMTTCMVARVLAPARTMRWGNGSKRLGTDSTSSSLVERDPAI
jgi:hypothetical protein